jgi:hypothetical protein
VLFAQNSAESERMQGFLNATWLRDFRFPTVGWQKSKQASGEST